MRCTVQQQKIVRTTMVESTGEKCRTTEVNRKRQPKWQFESSKHSTSSRSLRALRCGGSDSADSGTNGGRQSSISREKTKRRAAKGHRQIIVVAVRR